MCRPRTNERPKTRIIFLVTGGREWSSSSSGCGSMGLMMMSGGEPWGRETCGDDVSHSEPRAGGEFFGSLSVVVPG